VQDVSDAKTLAESHRSAAHAEDEAWDVGVTSLLKRLKGEGIPRIVLHHIITSQDYRPEGAPLLVLLDRNDIFREICSSMTHSNQLHKVKWLALLSTRLSLLCVVLVHFNPGSQFVTIRTSTHTPLLSTIYQNSPVRTSPPFASPHHFDTLQTDAERQAEYLSVDIVRLQKVRVLLMPLCVMIDLALRNWSQTARQRRS